MASPDYAVSLTPVAADHLAKMPREQQIKVAELLQRMRQNPASGATPLKQVASLVWKKRLGDIRILFTLDTRRLEVVIRAILWRRADTYDDLDQIVGEVKGERQGRRDSSQSQKKPKKKKRR